MHRKSLLIRLHPHRSFAWNALNHETRSRVSLGSPRDPVARLGGRPAPKGMGGITWTATSGSVWSRPSGNTLNAWRDHPNLPPSPPHPFQANRQPLLGQIAAWRVYPYESRLKWLLSSRYNHILQAH